MIHADQLPADVRAKLGLPAKRKRTSRKELPVGPCAYRCSCGLVFDTYNACERHADREGHSGRLEMVSPSSLPS